MWGATENCTNFEEIFKAILFKYEMGHPATIHGHEVKSSTGTACSYIMSPQWRDFSVENEARWV